MSAQTKEAVVAAIRSHGGQIKAAGVRRLGLFGSFVRSQQRPDSDIDILVEFDPARKTFDNFMRVSMLLEDLCQRRVDLVTTESLSPYLRPHIIKEVEYVHLAG
ncbi:MAG: nucleotidyltransferase family protein [Acidobacteriota bacterium]